MRLTRSHRRPPRRRSPANRTTPRRRRGPSKLQRLGFVYGMRAFFIGLAVTGALYAWQSGLPQRSGAAVANATVQFSGRLGLRIDDVLVEGRDRADSQNILDALRVDRDMPTLAFDAFAARNRLQELEWIESATVSRRLPGTIYVRVSEYRPIAVWQHDGRFALIDQAGDLIPARTADLIDTLPLVVGEGAPRHTAELLDTLSAFPDVARRMKAAVRVSERRWDLHLDQNIEVRLPEDSLASALGRLSDLNSKQALFERDVKAVDLRLPDRLILRKNAEGPILAGENT